MDDLDVRILRTMGVRPYDRAPKDPERLQAPAIARALRTSVNTVKERIARMESAGLIAGYQVVPNLRHFGLQASAWEFLSPEGDAKDAVVEAAAAMDGALEVHDFLGRPVCVDFAYEDVEDLRAKLRALSELTGDTRPVRHYDRHAPDVRRPLTPLDWRILGALRWRAKRPLSEVAGDLGVALRTVRRRHDRMVADGSFLVVPLLDPSKAEGLLLFNLVFYFRRGHGAAATREILRRLDGRQLYAHAPPPETLAGLDILAVAKSTREVEDLRRSVAGVAGVDRVEALFFRGFHDRSAWMDAAIEERIRAPARPVVRARQPAEGPAAAPG